MRRVAITGFGVVSPVGSSREAFWAGLKAGRSGVSRITRFDCSTFAVQLAGEVKDCFSLPEPVARAAVHDPKIAYGFAACAEALAQAGIARLDDHSLLHLGVSLEIFDMQRAICDGRPDIRKIAERSLGHDAPPLQIPLDTGARLITEQFGRPGRSLTNCSACAAGAQAIGHGFRSVRASRCELAVCGGFDSMINPLGVGGFQMLGALTTDNARGPAACRPFDAARSGTVLGEGAAVLVLEPLDVARAEGKAILAEMCGYGSSMDACSLSAPDPDGDGAVRSMRAALADAGIEPQQIGHINTHGTGTRLNDEVEARSIRNVFAECWQRIPVSSTKSTTGHLIAAAGAVEAGACLLALLGGWMPANRSLDKIDRGCELNHVVGEAARFDGEYVLSNSFGFGGQNATLVFRRYNG